MRVGSLFSGVGGFDLGLERAGFSIAWQVECDPFARRILAARWPHVACGIDVRQWPGDRHEPLDLLVGGFPCQDLSVAGKRAGLAGARSGLFHEFIRIARAIQPTWGLVENVPGLFSSHGGRDLATVLEGLRKCWPVVGYAVLDSQYFGVPQRRRRLFLVGGPSEQSVEQVLFESQSGGGDLAPSGEARTDVAVCLRGRSSRPGVSAPGRRGEDDMNLVCQALTNLASGGPDDNEAQAGHLVAHTLRGEGFDASEDGTCRGTPLVPIAEVGAKTQMGGGRNGCGIGRRLAGVRRLTPTECERLQGFPDGWTCLCQPLAEYDATRCTCHDGPRYKTMGNAVTVPVLEYFGRRLAGVR